MATNKTATTAAEKPSDLIRVLTEVCLIDSEKFAKLAANRQTAVLDKADGKPIRFVATFSELSNKRRILADILAGKDVSLEFEFNGIELSAEEIMALRMTKAILAKIGAISPPYPWLPEQDFSDTIKFERKDLGILRKGHYMSTADAKRVWRNASKLWAGNATTIEDHPIRANGVSYANHICSYSKISVAIGCQTIWRAEVEFIARHYNWEPAV